MPGCKGACSFSNKRNDSLKCIDGCRKGYIYAKEGICELCEKINEGCYECHYEDNYPENYLKIKRKRRFVCDFCLSGYINIDGECFKCSNDLNFDNCEECELDRINNNKYICTKCDEFSILSNGKCIICDYGYSFKNENECILCNDIGKGGINGCSLCEKNEKNELICQLCKAGFILLTNNNTCLNISSNKELEKFEICEKLTLDNNNQLFC